MDFNKFRKTCKPIRIVVGTGLIITAVVTDIHMFYLGIIPLIAGFADFCPVCIITQKCDLPEPKNAGEKNESN